ncbi:protein kinase domain containing protein [Stylonychia lemnae]|uniref:non-specific serine/threonine protein kinase n=1 Tax=Stylonychia lemnae TaxID=5949 RepID=A0A077ZTW6_STYLE|nr:protein kinase domain containing protein [Stylonychia lemnae]|eukprot:CDW73307.1 protein kinase domain containing protein [Stylonychia lemnae]
MESLRDSLYEIPDDHDYIRLAEIGSGAFAIVDKVKRQKDGKIFAMKTIKDKVQEKDYDEVKTLQGLDDPFIIKFEEAFTNNYQRLFIVTEFAEKGTLQKYIEEQGELKQPQIISIFTQICLENILIMDNDLIKIADFGFSLTLMNSLVFARSKVGTPSYMAPEIIDQKPYNNKVDIYSLGLILYYMYTRQIVRLSDAINQNIPFPKNIPKHFQAMIRSMLKFDPNQRPSIEQILEYEVLQFQINTIEFQVIRTDQETMVLGNMENKLRKQDIQVRNHELKLQRNILYTILVTKQNIYLGGVSKQLQIYNHNFMLEKQINIQGSIKTAIEMDNQVVFGVDKLIMFYNKDNHQTHYTELNDVIYKFLKLNQNDLMVAMNKGHLQIVNVFTRKSIFHHKTDSSWICDVIQASRQDEYGLGLHYSKSGNYGLQFLKIQCTEGSNYSLFEGGSSLYNWYNGISSDQYFKDESVECICEPVQDQVVACLRDNPSIQIVDRKKKQVIPCFEINVFPYILVKTTEGLCILNFKTGASYQILNQYFDYYSQYSVSCWNDLCDLKIMSLDYDLLEQVNNIKSIKIENVCNAFFGMPDNHLKFEKQLSLSPLDTYMETKKVQINIMNLGGKGKVNVIFKLEDTYFIQSNKILLQQLDRNFHKINQIELKHHSTIRAVLIQKDEIYLAQQNFFIIIKIEKNRTLSIQTEIQVQFLINHMSFFGQKYVMIVQKQGYLDMIDLKEKTSIYKNWLLSSDINYIINSKTNPNEMCLALNDIDDQNGGLRFISFDIESSGILPVFDTKIHYYEKNVLCCYELRNDVFIVGIKDNEYIQVYNRQSRIALLSIKNPCFENTYLKFIDIGRSANEYQGRKFAFVIFQELLQKFHFD